MQPLALCPDNPHYLQFRGEPAVLITSAEHYGAVLNLDFDYATYLEALAAHGFNLTRIFSGVYRELPGSHGIAVNTLAPAPGRFICPWQQVDGGRYDLGRWDPAYFERLRDFMAAASRCGIVVEYVFFCFWYDDGLWAASPMNAANNTAGIGNVPKEAFLSLEDADLVAAQDRLVRKVVEELSEFDNLYYEVCNEPYSFHDDDLRLDWQHHVVDVITDAEAGLPHRHLIAINQHNRTARVREPHPNVGVYNFHYAHPSAAVDNYHLDRVIGDDETGFMGQSPTPYRREAWEFMLAGGGVFNHLDYSFTVEHPDGTAPILGATPGWGGTEWRRQLQVLRDFMAGLDFVRMGPHNEVVLHDCAPDVSYQVLAEPGRQYAAYLWGGPGQFDLPMGLTAGDYRAEWINVLDGHVIAAQDVHTTGGICRLRTPLFAEDVALRVMAV